MPSTSETYSASAAPASGVCQTEYLIEHFSEKKELRLKDNTLVETLYQNTQQVIRSVECIDPMRAQPFFRLEITPEELIRTGSAGVDDQGRDLYEHYYVTRMTLQADIRCEACANPETGGVFVTVYQNSSNSIHSDEASEAELEYATQKRFHENYEYTPKSADAWLNPGKSHMLKILKAYGLQWGSAVEASTGLTSFFSPCATETTSTGCVS